MSKRNVRVICAMAMLIVMALLWDNRAAGASAVQSEGRAPADNRELTASLITCWPGSEIYELCGHTALRIRGEGIDSVWNYGLFNFNEPNFIYRFVKGETDYMVAGYPFAWFLPEYVSAGRRVVEQDLNLTPEETITLLRNLREASLPPNSRYRYNYVKDNCSTRVINQIEEATPVKINYPDTSEFGTFRDEMRVYHKNYPWYQFGIDLALGSGLDYPLSPREEMFVPVVLYNRASAARLSDGRSLVREERILNEGTDNAVLPPTSWWAAPLALSWLVSLIALCLGGYDMWKWRISKGLYFIWFFILALAGTLVSFLVFISVHEATSPNALVLWLNPLQFLFCIGILSRRLRILSIIMAWYNVIVVTGLLISWPFISQSANPAFFPLMGSTAMLAAIYAIINRKKSYNIRLGSIKTESAKALARNEITEKTK